MASKHTAAMNLNTATARELTQLPRVGADKARRIVRYRAIRQGFRDWADFGGTPGITAADVTAIQTRAWIGPSPAGLRPISAACSPIPERDRSSSWPARSSTSLWWVAGGTREGGEFRACQRSAVRHGVWLGWVESDRVVIV